MFEKEPLASDHPFISMPNVVLSGHVSWYSKDAVQELQTRAAREIVRGALESGMSTASAYFFNEVDPATDFIVRTAKPGDMILVKGSRGTQLDRMVRALKAAWTERTN